MSNRKADKFEMALPFQWISTRRQVAMQHTTLKRKSIEKWGKMKTNYFKIQTKPQKNKSKVIQFDDVHFLSITLWFIESTNRNTKEMKLAGDVISVAGKDFFYISIIIGFEFN